MSDSLAARRKEGTLSFWERYAAASLEERLPDVGFEGTEVSVPASVRSAPEQVAIRLARVSDGSAMAAAGLKVNDLLLEVGGEPFFRGNGGVEGLRRWLMRELRSQARDYDVLVCRGGGVLSLTASLKLGPYVPPATAAHE